MMSKQKVQKKFQALTQTKTLLLKQIFKLGVFAR